MRHPLHGVVILYPNPAKQNRYWNPNGSRAFPMRERERKGEIEAHVGKEEDVPRDKRRLSHLG